MIRSLLLLFQAALLASWSPSLVDAFAGIRTQRRATVSTSFGSVVRRSESSYPASIIALALASKGDDGEEEEEDPLLNDQREGMADAFSALDSLTADDFDDLRPVLSSTPDGSAGGVNMEESAKLFMEMQAELSTQGEEGVYADILGDLTGANPDADAPKSYIKTDDEDVTGLVQALDEAADVLADDVPSPAADTSVLYDADGLGAADGPSPALTTASVSDDILTQEIKPTLSMDEFMSSAIQEAVTEIESTPETALSESGRAVDIAKTAEQLLEDEELRKEIEGIFDRAGEKLRLEVEVMKKEQAAVTQSASQQGLDYIESEKQRISEAEESVTRLIQKVAKETDEVQKAMDDLEAAKDDASGQGSAGSIENTAIDLKKGGLVKQASLVGGLLFGSRAVTETILVLGSPYGDEHFVSAIVQAAIALACAAYFFLVK